jgi:hypothetical protein
MNRSTAVTIYLPHVLTKLKNTSHVGEDMVFRIQKLVPRKDGNPGQLIGPLMWGAAALGGPAALLLPRMLALGADEINRRRARIHKRSPRLARHAQRGAVFHGRRALAAPNDFSSTAFAGVDTGHISNTKANGATEARARKPLSVGSTAGTTSGWYTVRVTPFTQRFTRSRRKPHERPIASKGETPCVLGSLPRLPRPLPS